MKHKIYFLLALALLSSCMKVKKKTDEAAAPQPVAAETQESQEPEQQQPQQKAQIKEFSYEYSPQVEGRLQQVKFYFPNHWPDEIIIKKNAAAALAIHLDDSRTWSDAFIGKEKISYQFYRADDEQLTLIEDVEVLPALDLDLEQDFNLAKKFQLNTKTKLIYLKNLKLAANTRLYLEDYSGRIQIKNLKSAGFIQTFSDEARAQDEQNGRSGGTLQIDIASAEGQLTVAMIGESGGNGKNGKEPDESKRGIAGAPGKDAVYREDLPPSLGGGFLLPIRNCQTQPSNGEPGGQGLQGYPGVSGKNGGNSGYAVVWLKEKTIEITSITRAGEKGLGGLGGQGGEGGLGGAAGSRGESEFNQTNCKAAIGGARGEKGRTGNSGNDGRDGIEGKNQLYINGEKSSFVNEN